MRRVVRKRRREGKTDYQARALLLRSKTRLVVRKSNRYIIAEIVESKKAQDFVIAGVSSERLREFGVKDYSIKNLMYSYLIGYMLGRKSSIKEAILDSGIIRSTKGSRIYAVVKGCLDAGMKIKVDEKMLPNMEMIKKKNFDELLNKIKNAKIEKKKEKKK